jgi:DNA repair protein RadC
VLSSPEATAEVVLEWFKVNDDDREHFLVLLLNAQNRLLLVHTVSLGTQSASLVHPREVFGPALREGAASILLAHNHPSGDPTPSREDLALTRQLVEAGKLLDIKVHDHVIVGCGTWQYVSLAQRGQL